jgi:xanthine/CO dehydrogenase XdhC/CoxF family maturation factor
MTGLLSGGCLERDLAEHAGSVLATGRSAIAQYDMRSADDLVYGIGAGCEGAMRVLLERVRPGEALLSLMLGATRTLATGAPVVLAVVHDGPIESLGTRDFDSADAVLQTAMQDTLNAHGKQSMTLSDGRAVFIEALAPTPNVLVCGAGPDAVSLVDFLNTLGFRVTVVDHRPLYLEHPSWGRAKRSLGPAGALAERLPLQLFDAAIVMSHHLESDASYLESLADSPIPHVGLLGPRARRERLLGMIGNAAARLRPRLRGPVGLDIGAVTPEAISLAIVTELYALISGRSARIAGTSDDL